MAATSSHWLPRRVWPPMATARYHMLALIFDSVRFSSSWRQASWGSQPESFCFSQLSPYDHSPCTTFSLTRGWASQYSSVLLILPRHGQHRKRCFHGLSVVVCLFSNSSIVTRVFVVAGTCYRSLLSNGRLFSLHSSGFERTCHNIKIYFKEVLKVMA
jgi:transposase